MTKKLVIAGAGDFGREVAALVKRINSRGEGQAFALLGFVDDNDHLQGCLIDGIPVLGKVDWINSYQDELWVVCSIGTGSVRKKIIGKITNPKVKFPSLVDPDVIFLGDAYLGEGSIICAASVISVNVKVGRHSIVNLACTLGHDVSIGEYCTINPGSNLSGFVETGECVDIGTGTKIIQHIKIGKNSTIGAGTVVIRDIEENVTAVGNPARVVKYKG